MCACVCVFGDTRSVMVTLMRNGLGDPILNP